MHTLIADLIFQVLYCLYRLRSPNLCTHKTFLLLAEVFTSKKISDGMFSKMTSKHIFETLNYFQHSRYLAMSITSLYQFSVVLLFIAFFHNDH